jgi:uncharacterized protein
MPTNLPPDYYEVEKRFRDAYEISEKIALLEEMYSLVPKHKGTDHLRADLRKQLSKLKAESQQRRKQGYTSDYHIEKEGAGQVVVIGPPNTGKSALVTALTNASPEVSDAYFTTRKPIPGMMPVWDIQVQLVDTPSLNRDLSEGGLFALIRQADLLLLMVDLQADPVEQVLESLALMQERRLAPEEFAGMFNEGDRIALKQVILLVNKFDNETFDEDYRICCELMALQESTKHLNQLSRLPVSAMTGRNFDALKEAVFKRLDIIRIYAKPPGKEPDLERPFVLRHGSTVIDLARKVHRDIYENLKFARVWGSVEFDGQMVNRDYVLQDKDIVELKT